MFFSNVLKITVLASGVVALSNTPEVIAPYVFVMVTCFLLYIQAREQGKANERQTDKS
jgi:hypothetical protein